MTRAQLNTMLRRVGVVVAALSLAGPPGRAQTPPACYVPIVGAIYLIGLPGLPPACLANHVQVSLGAKGLAAVDNAGVLVRGNAIRLETNVVGYRVVWPPGVINTATDVFVATPDDCTGGAVLATVYADGADAVRVIIRNGTGGAIDCGFNLAVFGR
jgi:hypothetical protein